MKYELIIAEKPNAALKIAEALADKKTVKKSVGKISYYELEHKGKRIVVGCAVGHLFTIAEKDKKAWTYPIFNYEWKASYLANKDAKYTKAYVDNLKNLAKDADEITVATDYDLEGSTIGWNIVKYICNRKDAKRMKFSTLTKEELVESYNNASKHLDFPQIEAGVTRHSLDWLWGINLSRALTLSVKNATNTFSLLSTGRVQGPTLKLIEEKEKEIEKFKPTPYWEIELIGNVKTGEEISAWHVKGKILERKIAEQIIKITDGKKAIIKEIEIKEFKQKPPIPFDLTSLQIEAYSVINISPQKTLEIAQELYTNGYISYPRTSSQKLPESIGYKKIIESLSKIFNKECKYLLSKKLLKPNEGQKTDAAHPSIFPTGEIPKKLEGKSADLYELIARRFFSVFGEDAIRETMTVTININDELFLLKGTTTKEKGWYELYGRFVKSEEEELPQLEKNEEIKVREIKLYDKETKPPARYNEASLIKEMEKENLGTKATRSVVVQNLFDRNYLVDKPIKITDLGKATVNTLEKYCPEVVDVELTRKFEEDMDAIQEAKKKGEEVVENAKEFLDKTLAKFKKHEKEIGKELGKAAIETRDKESYIGKCTSCKEGELHIRRGKFGMFAACNRYEEGCKTTFALPRNGLVKSANKSCEVCSYPKVLIFRAKRKPQELCINPNCESKKAEEERLNKLVEGKKCPNCKSQLIIKNGFYGPFMACPGYPKCKYIEKLPKE